MEVDQGKVKVKKEAFVIDSGGARGAFIKGKGADPKFMLVEELNNALL